MRPVFFIVLCVACASQVACAATGASAANAEQARLLSEANTVRQEANAEKLEASGDGAATLGDMTRAEQYFMAALRVGGTERRLIQKLVTTCALDGRYPAALQYAEDYLHRHPWDTQLRFAAAAIAAVVGDPERARVGFERVISAEPTNAEAHYALASLMHREGMGEDEAREHFEAYLKLAPEGEYAESARAALLRRE